MRHWVKLLMRLANSDVSFFPIAVLTSKNLSITYLIRSLQIFIVALLSKKNITSENDVLITLIFFLLKTKILSQSTKLTKILCQKIEQSKKIHALKLSFALCSKTKILSQSTKFDNKSRKIPTPSALNDTTFRRCHYEEDFCPT